MTSKELIEQYNEYISKKTKGLRKESKIALEEIVISMKKNSDTIDDFLYHICKYHYEITKTDVPFLISKEFIYDYLETGCTKRQENKMKWMFKLARSNFIKFVKNPYYKTSNFLLDYLKIFKEDEEVFNMLKKLYMNELSYATHEIEYGLLLPETEFDELFLEIDLFERYFKNSIYYDNGHFIRTVNEYRKMIEDYTNREKIKLKDI